MQGQSVISAALGSGESVFVPRRSGTGFELAGGGVRADVGAGGVSLSASGGSLSLALAGVARGRLSARANRVLVRRPGVSEWYAAGPLGVEQGFTLTRRPAGTGPVSLTLTLTGSLRAQRSGSQIAFRDRSGSVALRYGGLSVVDASGRQLPAWLSLRGRALRIGVRDRGARYPLIVNPFVQQGSKLTGGGESGAGLFGISAALSSDGNTALIGAARDNSNVGAAWVFTRSGATWIQQGAKLTGGGETGAAQFGTGAALSGDGNTALIGGPGDNGGIGAVWVFTRSGATWTQQGAKLSPSDESGGALFGAAIALSGDGDTALIGGWNDHNAGLGAAWVFTRSGATFTQLGSKLTPSDEVGGRVEFGVSVALSGDGSTALIGGPGDTPSVINGFPGNGAAWVFTRSGSTFTQQGAKLTGGGETPDAGFGDSVALPSDGNTALIGGPFDGPPGHAGVGAAWVFTRSGSTWTQQGAKLTGSDESGAGGFGYSAALSSDGNTALISAPNDNGGIGAAWLFSRSSTSFTQQGAKLTGSGETGAAQFGESVAMPAVGNTALIGGSGDNSNIGAAWAFTPGVTLAVSLAGTGSGTVTGPGISCPGACSHDYATATTVTLTATPAAGGSFSGWSGACSGTGTCTVTMSTAKAVTATFKLLAPNTKIAKAKVSKKRHTATFRFKASGATGFQCALVKVKKTKKHHNKPKFSACSSPKSYKHLKHGKYTFEARALSHAAVGPIAMRNFKV